MNRLNLSPIPAEVTLRWRLFPRRCVTLYMGRVIAKGATQREAKENAMVFFREERRLSGRNYHVTFTKE